MIAEPDAERSLIGALLRAEAKAADVFADASAIVRAEDFQAGAHRDIWEIVADFVDQSRPVDLVTVSRSAYDRGKHVDVYPSLLMGLWEEAPAAANVTHYAVIIRDKAMLRRAVDAAREIEQAAQVHSCKPDELLALADALFSRIQSRTVGLPRPIAASVERALAEWQERSKSLAPDSFAIQTPWPKFNALTGGLKRGTLAILAARPSVGKTLLALNILRHASEAGRASFFASLEQRDVELVERFVAAVAQVAGTRFRRGVDPVDERKVLEATTWMARQWKLWIEDEAEQTVTSIIANCRRMARTGLDLVVVDFLGIIRNDTRHVEAYDYLAEMTRRLRACAKSLNIHILVCCQLNRQSVARADGRPKLADLRDCGKIEEAADDVYLLHRPGDPKDEAPTQMLELEIAKQRNGPTGLVTLLHAKRFFEVRELAAVDLP